MTKHVKAIIFDLDGVIIDTLPIMQESFSYAYKQVVSSTEEPPFHIYKRHLGKSLPHILEIMNLPQSMHPLYVEKSKELLCSTQVYPGIEKIIKLLAAQNIKLGIATGKSTDRAVQILNHLGLADYFNLVIGYDAVKKPKPSPDCLIKFAAECQLNKNEIIFIGDSISDIETGKNASIATAAVAWGYGNRTELKQSKSDFFLEAVEDIPKLLSKTHEDAFSTQT